MPKKDEALLDECILALLLVGFSSSEIIRFALLASKEQDLGKRIKELE